MQRWITLGLVGAFLAATACGEDAVRRPLSIDVMGLSSLAETLVIQLFPGGSPACSGVTMATIRNLDAPIRLVWVRADGEERRLSAPVVDAEVVTVTAHSEDGAGAVLQLGCQEVNYLDIESPEVEIALSAVAP